LFLAVLVAEN